MVTRELLGTEAKVLRVNVADQTTTEVSVVVKGRYKTPENLLKAIKRKFDTANLLHLKVIEFHETRKLYGMAEDKFYIEAVELNRETRKPLNA